MKKLWQVAIFVGLCELVGLAATPFTLQSIPGWYAGLMKPAFSPPNWVFGPVWTMLYLLMGVAARLVWKKGTTKKPVRRALVYFTVQLGLNFLWSVLFFGWHSPILGLWEIIILWGAIFLTILQFKKISSVAVWLLVPYILWVSFALILNLMIVVLNP